MIKDKKHTLFRLGWFSMATAYFVFPLGFYIKDWSYGLFGWNLFMIQGLLFMLVDSIIVDGEESK